VAARPRSAESMVKWEESSQAVSTTQTLPAASTVIPCETAIRPAPNYSRVARRDRTERSKEWCLSRCNCQLRSYPPPRSIDHTAPGTRHRSIPKGGRRGQGCPRLHPRPGMGWAGTAATRIAGTQIGGRDHETFPSDRGCSHRETLIWVSEAQSYNRYGAVRSSHLSRSTFQRAAMRAGSTPRRISSVVQSSRTCFIAFIPT